MRWYCKHIVPLLVLALVFFSCLEEIPLVTQNTETESLIVVEATITDQLKHQKIKLSFSKKFEEETFLPLSNAQVIVEGNNGEVYTFLEELPGEYRSESTFAASTETSYTLNVKTPGGRTIISESEQISGVAVIDDITAEESSNDKGVSGIALKVATSPISGDAKYFRYEYEETYKIIAPNWTPFEFKVINDAFPDFEVDIEPRIEEQKTCYAVNISTDIILNQPVSNTGDGQFEFRFLSRDNPFLAHRYSVNLIQYTQSINAANYWKTLLDFTSQENIFSQVQPGFLSGNLKSITDDDLVVGYFEIAAVTKKRIFLNRNDFYNAEEERPYFVDCSATGSPPLFSLGAHQMGVQTSPLIDAIRAGLIAYYGLNQNPQEGQGPFFTTKRECGDCTTLGSNIKPEFWID